MPSSREKLLARQIEIIHCLGDIKIRVRVEPFDEIVPSIPEVALNLEIRGEIEAVIFLLEPPGEFLFHRLVAHVCDMPYHARHGKSPFRFLYGVIIIANIPRRIRHNGLPAYFIESYLLGRMFIGRCYRYGALDTLGK